MKKIIFRADGNSATGLGHLYRIFALIEIYKTNFDFVLLTKENTTPTAIPSTYNYQLIPNAVTIEEEPAWLNKNFNSGEYLIIADGYQFTEAYQKKLKRYNYQLVYVDDQIKDKMYADIVINHAMSVKSNDYKSEHYTKFALGTSYAILRPQFLEAAKQERKIKEINSAFVCFGGADALDLTLKATQALLGIKSFTQINVVVGAAYNHEAIFELEKNNSNLHIYKNLSESDLLNVMSNCNFAIAPASTILYELCSVKMPILSGYYVENQKNIYKGCLQAGCIIDGGNFESFTVNDFEQKIQNVLQLSDFQTYINAQAKLFDSKIKDRFLNLLLPISYRKANENDLLLIYNWANDKLSRANSYYTEPITLETHKNWFEKKLKDDNCQIYIAELNNKPAGMIRYETSDDKTIVGILVDENFRGFGLASEFLKGSSKIYFKTHTQSVLAYIKKQNTASIKSFENANYKFLKEEVVHTAESVVYQLKKEQ